MSKDYGYCGFIDKLEVFKLIHLLIMIKKKKYLN